MIWIVGGLILLVVVVGTIAGVGSTLPREHVATVRARFRAAPDALWAVMSDVGSSAAWRSDVKAVEQLPAVDGRPAWRELTRNGAIPFVLEASDPPRRRVTRIADDALPFGGTWETVLEPVEGGTVVTITERGVVKPAVFRFLARYAFSYTSTMQAYLAALGARLGESAVIEVVASGR